MSLFLSDVEVDSVRCSVLVNDSTVAAVGAHLTCPPDAQRIDGNGGMLLPGLHDHHVHLLSSAAAARSVNVGPPDVRSAADLRRVLRDAATSRDGTWIRAIGYHESVAGPLDRDILDQITPSNPIRIQHRSGAMWFLNSLGLRHSRLEDASTSHGERDGNGRLTGRLWRSGHVFETVDGDNFDDLEAFSDSALRRGVTGFTDAAPNQTDAGLEMLAAAHEHGAIRQRLTLMSPIDVTAAPHYDVAVGPVKVLLDDVNLPPMDDLVATIELAHRGQRAVAIHCVTDVQTALALTAVSVAGPIGSDRIEHGALMPFAFDTLARACEVTVVTQPHFIAERGDDYLREVPEASHGELYRARTLIDARIPIAGGTDAPFGSSDPWVAIAAATRRTTRSGAVVGPRERLTPMQAIQLFTGDVLRPGRQRRIVAGARADFCLLSLDTKEALEDLSSKNVRATIIDGRIAFER
jgi:predicted amidohydrolase YtcJ